MNFTTATIISLVAALTLGAAVLMLALAGWNLVRRQRFSRSGSSGISMRRAEMRQQAMEKSAAFRFALPFITSLASTVNQLGLEPLRQYVHDPYIRAGYPGGLDDDELVTAGVMLSIFFTVMLGFMSAVFFGFGLVWIGLVGLPLGFFALVAHLKSKAKERQVSILRTMPYAIDLLVLMLRSGTSLRIALARVIDDYSTEPLGAEFGQVLAEMDVGASRIDAFKKLAERLKIPDVTSLVDAVVQSEELGWPLADTLERLADRMSSDRVLRAQATAGPAGVLVMLPSALVLLSAVLLLFAPFIARVMVTGTLGD